MRENESGWMSVEYNLLPLGGVMRVPRPANITLFKHKLEARGLKDKEDFTARGQDKDCVIRRLTLKPMK